MAKLRAGVHEIARGRVGCKLGITPLNQMGLGVGGTHDIGGGGSVVAAVGGGARLAVGVGRARWLPLVDHQVYWHLALQAADVAVAEVVTQLVYLRTGGPLQAARCSSWMEPSVARNCRNINHYLYWVSIFLTTWVNISVSNKTQSSTS